MIFDEAEELMIKETARKLIAAGSRLMNTFNLILDVSIQGAKGMGEGFGEFDLVELVRSTGEEFERSAEAKGLRYTFTLPKNRMNTVLPAASLKTALKCLLDNAIKYTFAGRVELRLNPPTDETRTVRIEVEDTGIGIAFEHHEMIFEGFRQVSEGMGRDFEGTGLGLTVARKMIQNLGGDIKIKSAPGKGSIFTIELPVAILDLSIQEKPSNHGSPELMEETEETDGKPRILVFEKDKMSANVLKVSIRDDYTARLAFDQDSAIELMKQEKFDLIMVAVHREERENVIILKNLVRAIPGYEKTPLVALVTASPGEFLMNPRIQVFDAVLVKPFFKKDLMHAITSILGTPKE